MLHTFLLLQPFRWQPPTTIPGHTEARHLTMQLAGFSGRPELTMLRSVE
jgi:hypothetical protein